MTHDHSQPDDRLDAYLDGLLDPEDRLAFERTLESRPDLAREIEKQRAIDASLDRGVRVPRVSELRSVAERAVAARRRRPAVSRPAERRRPFVGRSLALAASIALLVTGAIMIWNVVRPAPNPYGPLEQMTMTEVYDAEIAAGFRPRVVCRDAEEFALWFSNQFDQGLALDLPEDHTALGLGYSNSISPESIHILAKTDGAQVILFVDRIDRDTRGAPTAARDLNVHRAEVGTLVIYELTPLPEARFLPHFRMP